MQRHIVFALVGICLGTASPGVVLHVDLGGTNPVPRYTTWETAATNIQHAVDVATNGETVLVADGTYETGTVLTPGAVALNRLVITNNIVVRSTGGASAATIKGEGPNGPFAVRCVYMTTGVLDGFTLTDGHTFTSGELGLDRSGGGAYAFGATLVNCVVWSNSAHYLGGGVRGGTLTNCQIRANTASAAGGVHNATLYDCTIQGNSVPHSAGGVGASALYRCIVSDNEANAHAGAHSSTLSHCTVSGNRSNVHGGGVTDGTLDGCILYGNRSNTHGGAANGATLQDCLVFANAAGNTGGGAYNCVIRGCTIVSNSASVSGGGVDASVLYNSIVWNNSASVSNNVAGSRSDYCCATPLMKGTGNIADDPAFIDPFSTNYRLTASSPCIDVGNNSFVQTDTDLDENPRIVFGTVDVGAHEFIWSSNDYDGDCLSNSDEEGIWHSDPTRPDSDGDGMDDGDEVTANTDPTNMRSVLAVVNIVPSDGVELIWTGGTNVRQFLECRRDLLSTAEQWSVIYTNDPVTPVTNAFEHSAATNGLWFYRVRVEPF